MRISLWIIFPSFVDIMSGGLFKLHIVVLTNREDSGKWKVYQIICVCAWPRKNNIYLNNKFSWCTSSYHLHMRLAEIFFACNTCLVPSRFNPFKSNYYIHMKIKKIY